MSCSRQTSKKYTSRSSPPYPANKCCGQTKKGNDGSMYVSTRNRSGVCSWSAKKRSRRTPTKRSTKSSSSSRNLSRKSKSKTSSSRRRKVVGTRDKSRDKPMSKMSRNMLIKEISKHASRWTRVTKKNQGMQKSFLVTEPVVKLKKHLKFYRDHVPADFGW